MAHDFATLVASRPETLLHLRSDGTILDAQLGELSPFELPAGKVDLVGARISELLAPDATSLVMEGVMRAMDTGAPTSCIWLTEVGDDRQRSYWQGRFRRCEVDELLAVISDATDEVCRHDADQHVAELSRLMIAVPHAETEGAVHDALRRTAWLVGGRGVVVLMPDDDSPHDFAIASAWAPDGIPANVPSLAIGDHSWLAEFLQDLERPVILAAADIPEEAAVLRWIADHQELAGIGLIPVVSAIDRVGVVAVGFSALPDRVGRLRFESLGALGPLVLSVRERHQHATDLYSLQPSTAVAAASEVERTAR